MSVIALPFSAAWISPGPSGVIASSAAPCLSGGETISQARPSIRCEAPPAGLGRERAVGAGGSRSARPGALPVRDSLEAMSR